MTAPDSVTRPHCRWCGRGIDPPKAKYCSRTHQRNFNKRRSALLDVPVQPCPHPEKRPIPIRGTAVLWAAELKQRFYECPCGVFHLTSQPLYGAARNAV